MMAWIHFSNTVRVRVYSLKGENSGLIILFNSGIALDPPTTNNHIMFFLYFIVLCIKDYSYDAILVGK